ncbi:hypothetical protein [Nocardia xishanensis]
MSETMTVTVRDRSAEAPWGVGLTSPVTRQVTISANCPRCGQRRGEPRGLNQVDDGAHYWVQVWINPCGHVDMYADVVVEAAARLEAASGALDPVDADVDETPDEYDDDVPVRPGLDLDPDDAHDRVVDASNEVV